MMTIMNMGDDREGETKRRWTGEKNKGDEEGRKRMIEG